MYLLLLLSEAAPVPLQDPARVPHRPSRPIRCPVEPFLWQSGHGNAFLPTPASPFRLEASQLQPRIRRPPSAGGSLCGAQPCPVWMCAAAWQARAVAVEALWPAVPHVLSGPLQRRLWSPHRTGARRLRTPAPGGSAAACLVLRGRLSTWSGWRLPDVQVLVCQTLACRRGWAWWWIRHPDLVLRVPYVSSET